MIKKLMNNPMALIAGAGAGIALVVLMPNIYAQFASIFGKTVEEL